MNSYTFYVEKKVSLWERETHEVEAETYEEAKDKIIKMFKEDECESGESFIETETLYDTMHHTTVEDNDGYPTAELYDEAMVLIVDNTEKTEL
jgi:hypothetical protein